ncbi:hypothetical protein BRC86_06140 [Halobacteriales archaeon QS_3_64_16]|nr:MAG: hypothetical protein BRC86_06140 [Halobacteriales archaeon QS_3_64_16]
MSSDSDQSDRSDRSDAEHREREQSESEAGTTDRTAVRDALEAALEDAAIDESTGKPATDEANGEGSAEKEPTDEQSTRDESTEDEPAPWKGASGSDPDRSTLDRVAIRRFTASVLDAYGGEVDRETNGRWSVVLPETLAAELGYEQATFVFDPEDRTVGSDQIVVAPGTRAFNALCALAGSSAPESEPPSSAASTAPSEPVPTPEEGEARVDDRPEGEGAIAGGVASGVGRLHLGSDVLQLHVPPTLEAGEFETTIEDFSPRGEERALAFQFRAGFLSVRSYQREETHTITVDPATRSVLPGLASRLNAHLPRLLDPSMGERGGEEGQGNQGTKESRAVGEPFDRETVRSAYSAAKRGVSEAVEPTAETLQEKEETAIEERIEEIGEYYDRRRAELDEQVASKRAAISEYSEKYDRAAGDETRLRYLREQREAEEDLADVIEQVEARKEELRSEERERIDEEIERHRIDVEVDLASVTALTYERGSLSLMMTDGETTAQVSVSYVPATEEYFGLDCESCGTDLLAEETRREASANQSQPSAVDRLGLCIEGHLVCDECAVRCRTCEETRCSTCLEAAGAGTESDRAGSTASAGIDVEPFEACWLCREAVCGDCLASCEVCGEGVCADHRAECRTCGAVACLACGEPCVAGGEFHCDTHLTAPDTVERSTESSEDERSDEKRYCEAHVASCGECGGRRAIDAMSFCGACSEALCESHRRECGVCGETRCGEHAIACEHCVDERERAEAEADSAADPVATFCSAHAEACRGGGEVVCGDHSQPGVIVDGPVCDDHRSPCELCKVRYAEAGFEDGRCPACRNLSTETPAEPPVAAIAEDFPTTRIGTTPTHAVVQGKRRLRRDDIVVVDRQSGEELRRSKADFFSKLSGDP